MPDQEAYRQAAAECLEIATGTTDLQARQRLVVLAAKFLDLVSDGQDSLLRRLIDEFNEGKMRK